MFSVVPLRMMRFGAAVAVLAGAAVMVSPLSIRSTIFPDTVVARALLFYSVTLGAYGVLPFVRRGDVALVAMWLVLAVGVTPCIAGQELSATHMFADMGGVILAALPIYIARFRQVAQGDTRLFRRRATDAST